MGNRYASGKFAIAQCDRCDQRFKLKELRTEIVKTRPYRLKVCKACWNPDHPQLKLGMYPVNDPQAVREPRPDTSYLQAGTTGLQELLFNSTSVLGYGFPTDGSRNIQWGWNPVGGAQYFSLALTPNDLVVQTSLTSVTISIS